MADRSVETCGCKEPLTGIKILLNNVDVIEFYRQKREHTKWKS